MLREQPFGHAVLVQQQFASGCMVEECDAQIFGAFSQGLNQSFPSTNRQESRLALREELRRQEVEPRPILAAI